MKALIGKKFFSNFDKNSKVLLFLNILINFTLHETMNHDTRDLSLITKSVKQLIKEKNRMNKNLVKLRCSLSDNSVSDLETFKTLQNKLTSLIASSKQKYYTKAARKFYSVYSEKSLNRYKSTLHPSYDSSR